jgi:hypothetical protein
VTDNLKQPCRSGIVLPFSPGEIRVDLFLFFIIVIIIIIIFVFLLADRKT